jgi:hypothetical protein
LVTPGIVNEYLRILNLQFQYNGAQWEIPFHQENVEVDVVLTLSENFLRFEVPLMAEDNVSPELLNQLFAMNYAIAMAKFAIADDGMIRLVCDFPTIHLSFEEFQVSLQVVVAAAFDFIPQIAQLKARPIGFEIPRNPRNQIM